MAPVNTSIRLLTDQDNHKYDKASDFGRNLCYTQPQEQNLAFSSKQLTRQGILSLTYLQGACRMTPNPTWLHTTSGIGTLVPVQNTTNAPLIMVQRKSSYFTTS